MLLCACALLFGAGFGMYMLSMSDSFKIEHIEVDGNERLSNEEILALSDIRHGQGTFDLDLELIGQRLEENDWILKAQVERLLPRGSRLVLLNINHVALSTSTICTMSIGRGRFSRFCTVVTPLIILWYRGLNVVTWKEKMRQGLLGSNG